MNPYTRDQHADTPLPLFDQHFSGETYSQELDKLRLNEQTTRVYLLMMDGEWRTLREIALVTNDPEASISARLRDLRKPRFGAFDVERRRRGDGKSGLFEYRLSVREE